MSGILVVAEHTRGVLADISAELVGAAVSIKKDIGGPLCVIIVGQNAEQFVPQMNLQGVDKIITACVGTEHFDATITEEAVYAAALREQPELIAIGHSSSGMSFAAGLAVRLGSGFAADIFAIGMHDGSIHATRSGYGGKVNIEIGFPNKPMVVMTLRGATFKPPIEDGNAELGEIEVDVSTKSAQCTKHLDYIEAPSAGVDIGKAEFIMSIGRGIQDEKNIPRFEALAEKLGATLGCSRPIADSGWLHKGHQVGLTGKVAANCKLYVALGISGAVQHLHGMKHVETIIAVNTDPNAPIFNHATYGAVVDLFELCESLEKM